MTGPEVTAAVRRATIAAAHRAGVGFAALDAPTQALHLDVTRTGLAAALDVEAVAEEMARKSSAYLWSTDHRDLLVEIASDAERADAIIKESQQGVIDQKRKVVADVRAAILGGEA